MGHTLLATAEHLMRVATASEARFLSIGDSLGATMDAVNSVRTSFDRIQDQLQGDANGSGDLVSSLADVVRVTERIGLGEDQSGNWDALEREIEGVLTRLQRIQQVVGEIDVLGMNAKIQASHLRTQQAEFTSFTGEIKRLCTSALDTIAVFGEALHGLKATLVAIRDSQQALSQYRQVAHNGVLVLAGLSRETAAAAAQIRDRSQTISQRIGAIISALQINDITTQRLQHVGDALRIVAESDGAEWSANLSHDDIAAVGATICHLQEVQCDRATADLSEQLAPVGTKISEIITDIQMIYDETRRLMQRSNSGSQQSTGLVSDILTEAGKVAVFIQRFAAQSSEATAVSGDLETSFSTMAMHIQALSGIDSEMRIVALNATLRCGRLGDEGRALAIIAQELRACSRRIEEQSRAIGNGLQQSRRHAEALTGADAAELTPQVDKTVMTTVGQLDSAARQFSESMPGIDAAIKRATQTLTTAKDALGEAERLGETLRPIVDNIRAAAGPEPVLSQDLREIVSSLLEQHYTMESESRLHRQFDGSVASTAGNSAATTMDDIFF